jgi:hypothetical protein
VPLPVIALYASPSALSSRGPCCTPSCARVPPGLLQPFAMLPVLHFAASKQVMGRFASSPTLFAVSGGLALMVMSINVMLVIEFIQAPPAMSAEGGEPEPAPPAVIAVLAVLGVGYFGVCARLMGDEILAAASIISVRVLGRDAFPRQPRTQILVDEHGMTEAHEGVHTGHGGKPLGSSSVGALGTIADEATVDMEGRRPSGGGVA